MPISQKIKDMDTITTIFYRDLNKSQNIDEFETMEPKSMYRHQNIDNPFREALYTGYFVRCAENEIKKLHNNDKKPEPDQGINDILHSGVQDRIKEIAFYLNDHKEIGLQKKISDYSLLPFDIEKNFLKKVIDEMIENFIKIEQIPKIYGRVMTTNMFREIVSKYTYLGYLYKLAGEIEYEYLRDYMLHYRVD